MRVGMALADPREVAAPRLSIEMMHIDPIPPQKIWLVGGSAHGRITMPRTSPDSETVGISLALIELRKPSSSFVLSVQRQSVTAYEW